MLGSVMSGEIAVTLALIKLESVILAENQQEQPLLFSIHNSITREKKTPLLSLHCLLEQKMEDASAPQPPAPSPADLEKAKRLMSSMRNSKGTRPVTNSRQSLEGVEKPTASIRAIPQDPQRELVPGAKTHNPAELQQAASLSRSINRITEDPRKQVQIAQALMMEAKRIRNQTAGVVGLVFLAGALGFGGYMLYHRWNAAVAAAAAAAASV